MNKFLFFTFIMTFAFGGDHIGNGVRAPGDHLGNGGDGVFCYHRPIEPSEVLLTKANEAYLKDYWEYSQMIPSLKLDLPKGSDYKKIVLEIIERIKEIDFVRGSKMEERFLDKNFVSFPNKSDVLKVNDSHSLLRVLNEKNCYEIQLAFQIRNPLPFQSKVLIAKFLFDQLSPQHQAGLIIHELLYEQDINFAGAVDSDKIRHLTYVVSSNFVTFFDDLENGFSEKWRRFLEQQNLNYFSYGDQIMPPESDVKYLIPKDVDIIEEEVEYDGNAVFRAFIRFFAMDSFPIDKSKNLLMSSIKEINYEYQENKQNFSGSLNVRIMKANFSISRKHLSRIDVSSLPFVSKEVEISASSVEFLSEKMSIRGITSLILAGLKLYCHGECQVNFQEDNIFRVKGLLKVKNRPFALIGFNENGELEVLLEKAVSLRHISKKSRVYFSQVFVVKNGFLKTTVNVKKGKYRLVSADGERIRETSCDKKLCELEIKLEL